jgi:PRC-barrel domain
VKLADGRSAGKVHELIVDTGTMRTRYLDIRLDGALVGDAGDRDVLLPIGTARLDGRGDNVLVDNLTADQLATMPAYEHGSLTRDHEVAVRRHFSASTGTSATDLATVDADFYDHDHFDDSRFHGASRGEAGDTSADSSTASRGLGGANRSDSEVTRSVSREGMIARRADGSASRSVDGSQTMGDAIRDAIRDESHP